jgi:hypothetical protein
MQVPSHRWAKVLVFVLWAVVLSWQTLSFAADDEPRAVQSDEVLKGLRQFFEKTARKDGSFQAGIDPTGRNGTERLRPPERPTLSDPPSVTPHPILWPPYVLGHFAGSVVR